MSKHTEIKKIIDKLDKKAREHQRKIDMIKRIKDLIKANATKL